jgi:hypothetical protein
MSSDRVERRTFLQGTALTVLAAAGTLHARGSHAAPGWNGPVDLGAPPGGFNGSPAPISRNGSVDNVYVWGADHALWQLAWYDNRWHPWTRHDVPGKAGSAPAAGSMGPDHEHLFVRGSTDGSLWQKWWTGRSGWSGWVNLGAPPVGFFGWPTTISRNGSVANVYVWGNDDGLWQLAWYDNRWHPWVRHSVPVLTSDPAAGSMGPDHESVVYQGLNYHVWQIWWTAQGGWHGPVDLGEPPVSTASPTRFLGGPATISRNSSVDNIYVHGTDGALWQLAWYDNRWHPWVRHNDLAVGGKPGAGSMGPGHETVYVKGQNSHLWQKWWFDS